MRALEKKGKRVGKCEREYKSKVISKSTRQRVREQTSKRVTVALLAQVMRKESVAMM